MKDGEFIDLGNGLFYAHDDEWSVRGGGSPFGYVADTYAEERNVVFGPAAWNRGTGPQGGAILLEIGDWSLDPEVDPIPDHPTPFPGSIRLREAGKPKLGHFEGLRFRDQDTFLKVMSALESERPLRVATYERRLAAVKDDGNT